MFCEKCGANVDGYSACPNCGAPVMNTANPQYQGNNAYPNNAAYPNNPAYPDMYANNVQTPAESPTPILVFGILSLALSSVVAGLVFGILGLIKGNRYIANYGPISTQVKVGRGLSIAGIIVSAIMVVFWIIYIIALIAIGINGYY